MVFLIARLLKTGLLSSGLQRFLCMLILPERISVDFVGLAYQSRFSDALVANNIFLGLPDSSSFSSPSSEELGICPNVVYKLNWASLAFL